MPIRRLLDTTDLFAALPAEALAELRDRAEVRSYARNQVLFRQGDAAEELFIIDEGRVAIAQQAGDGRESVVAVLEDGALFGELPVVRRRAAVGGCSGAHRFDGRGAAATSRYAMCCGPNPSCCG